MQFHASSLEENKHGTDKLLYYETQTVLCINSFVLHKYEKRYIFLHRDMIVQMQSDICIEEWHL